jgi:hypothetical protein
MTNIKIPRNQIPNFVVDDRDRSTCPVCGMAVRVVRNTYGDADHYEKLYYGEEFDQVLVGQDPEVAAELREDRKGKKTVAIVGMSPTSCSLAPFDDPDVEIWGMNESHAFKWMKRATRWFQIHNTESWHRYIAKRDVRGHADWLKKNPWDIPIYMQYQTDEIPKSIGYPLHEVVDLCFHNFWKGKKHVKYFTSTVAYQLGIAVLEGHEKDKPDVKPFDRIEIYGIDMSDDNEYVKQKACGEWWIGLAMGMGIEIYTPENCQLLHSDLYGGNEQGAGWMGI